MTKCIECKKRKGKRYCIALGGYLCSLCCGLLREKKIYCPSSCGFLTKHKFYQEKRTFEKKHTSIPRNISPEEDILNDERMAWLAYHIEAPLKEYGEKTKLYTDKDALIALEYAREKIEKDLKLLYIPDEKSGPKNEIGEAIYQNIDNCRYKKRIILPGEIEAYKKGEKIQCLDRIIFSVKFCAQENFEGRNYIQQLITRFEKVKELSRQKKMITFS